MLCVDQLVWTGGGAPCGHGGAWMEKRGEGPRREPARAEPRSDSVYPAASDSLHLRAARHMLIRWTIYIQYTIASPHRKEYPRRKKIIA